jgi:hypothetical protein
MCACVRSREAAEYYCTIINVVSNWRVNTNWLSCDLLYAGRAKGAAIAVTIPSLSSRTESSHRKVAISCAEGHFTAQAYDTSSHNRERQATVTSRCPVCVM